MGDFQDGDGHVAMYEKERDIGDEGGNVLPGGSHAAVLRVHRVSPRGDGADRFAQEKVRRRWWAYRSKVEHPEDNESIEYGVPFVRVQSQPEP